MEHITGVLYNVVWYNAIYGTYIMYGIHIYIHIYIIYIICVPSVEYDLLPGALLNIQFLE